MGARVKSESDYAEFLARLEARGLDQHLLQAAREQHVTLRELYMGPRSRLISRARAVVWQALRRLRFSEKEIGHLFDADPSTIYHGIHRDLTPVHVKEPLVEVVVEGTTWAWFPALMRAEAAAYGEWLRSRYPQYKVEVVEPDARPGREVQEVCGEAQEAPLLDAVCGHG